MPILCNFRCGGEDFYCIRNFRITQNYCKKVEMHYFSIHIIDYDVSVYCQDSTSIVKNMS